MHPRPAATVILLRDASQAPYEVLMVQRNPALAFMGGYWVFPGGKVEQHDQSPQHAAFRELHEETALALAPGTELIPFARWITPVALPRRFDTWFFLAVADEATATAPPTVDGSEIVDYRWISPGDALEDAGALAFPTRKQLERLARHDSIDGLIDDARSRPVEPVLPEIVRDDGRPAIQVPGQEPERAVPEQPLPGQP